MTSDSHSDGLYFLKRNALFAPLGEDILSSFANALKAIALAKGETLFREGDPGDGMVLIKSGRLRLTSQAEAGEPKTLAYLGRGDAVGELALLTNEPHSFTVTADAASELFMLSKAAFDAILESHPLVGIHLSRALSKRLAVSFHPPQDKPKEPQVLVLVPGLPHEATILSVINLSISLVEQTRRKVLLIDMSPRSGDLARSLGLHPLLSPQSMIQEDDLLDFNALRRMITTHPSGLEILSLPAKYFQTALLSVVTPFMTLLKNHYDFTLLLAPTTKDPLSQVLMNEAQKVLLLVWDQAADLATSARLGLAENRAGLSTPVVTVLLQHPSSMNSQPADFRVPWSEMFHQPFRTKGTPYLAETDAAPAIAALDRVARALGKLRVGLAMGSGAAYGYALIGILQVFERAGIPIDMVSGTSMGALLGSFYCAGNSPERIREIAKGITKRWLWENAIADLTFPHSGFLAGQTLNTFLRSILGSVEFHQLLIPFAAIATDIRTGQEAVLKDGRVVDAVRASTSLPIVFQPALYKGRYLVDGGLINPVPTSTIATMGADILISVNLTAKPSLRRGLAAKKERVFPLGPRSPSVFEVFFKMIYTMQYEIAQSRTEIAHVVIAPDMRDFLWTEFHRSEDMIPLGEAAAEEAISKIKSLLPFFSDYCRVPLGTSLRVYG